MKASVGVSAEGRRAWTLADESKLGLEMLQIGPARCADVLTARAEMTIALWQVVRVNYDESDVETQA